MQFISCIVINLESLFIYLFIYLELVVLPQTGVNEDFFQEKIQR